MVKYSVTRGCLSRFHLSSRNLHIETERRQRPKIPPEDRFCLFCKNWVEDEIHVLYSVSKNDLSDLFFQKLNVLLNDFENQCDNQKLILVMLNNDPDVIIVVGKFVNGIFTVHYLNSPC